MLIRRSIAILKRTARARPAGYVQAVLARAQRADESHYWIDLADYLYLCRRHGSYQGAAPSAAGITVAPGLHAARPVPARQVPPPREGAPPQPPPPDTAAQVPAAHLAEIARRFAICKACEHARDDGFACTLHTGCCFGRFRSDIANACPAGRW